MREFPEDTSVRMRKGANKLIVKAANRQGVKPSQFKRQAIEKAVKRALK